MNIQIQILFMAK